MKNIVIIGSSSPLGSNLSEYITKKFKKKKFKLYNYSRKNKNFYFDKKTYFKSIKKIDHLFYFASKTPNKNNQLDFKSFIKNNYIGSLQLIQSLKEIPIKNIHISSSTSIFSKKNNILNLNSEIDMNSAYGLSKQLVNYSFKEFCINKKINLDILHCPTIIGKGYKKNFLGKIIQSIKNKKKIYIYNRSSYYNTLCSDQQIFDFFFKKKTNLINETFIGSAIDLKMQDIYNYLKSMNIDCVLKKNNTSNPIVDLNNLANILTGVKSSKELFLGYLEKNL